MKQKDYYLLLGVNKRSSKEEIKANYRKLAKKYHPDANVGSPEAEEVFKDLTVAYDTLTDKEKKKKYDRQVARYGYGIPPKGTAKKDVKYGVKSADAKSELITTLLGFGKGAKEMFETATADIKDRINAKQQPKKGGNIEASLEITLEEGFFGAEKKLSLKTIGGKVNNYTVQVPRGIKEGEKIRLAALGQPGKNGGKNGDLIITVKMKEHSNFKLEGLDIHMNLDVTYAQAVVGDKIKLKILGEQVDVDIPAGSKQQDKINIINKGYASADKTRGNLVIHLGIRHPEEITERERKIYEQLLRVEKQQVKEKQKS